MRQGLIAWGPAAAWAAVLFLLSELETVPTVRVFPGEDKVAHLAIYLVFGVALAWGRRRSVSGIPHWILMGLGGAYAVLDEWHQVFVPGRDSSLGDLVVDWLGLIIGYMLMVTLRSGPTGRRSGQPPGSVLGTASKKMGSTQESHGGHD